MIDTLRELLAGIGWSHWGLIGLVSVIAWLAYCAGVARMRTGFWHSYNRGRRW